MFQIVSLHNPSKGSLQFLQRSWCAKVKAYHMSWLATFANQRASMCRKDRT